MSKSDFTQTLTVVHQAIDVTGQPRLYIDEYAGNIVGAKTDDHGDLVISLSEAIHGAGERHETVTYNARNWIKTRHTVARKD